MEQSVHENKKNPLQDLMQTTMSKVHEMVDSNCIIGEPIVTQDGVTLIPVSKVSFGFGSGGSNYGKQAESKNFGGGASAGVKITPVAFLVVKDGTTRVLPVSVPATSTADRVLELIPDLLDKMEHYIDKKNAVEPR